MRRQASLLLTLTAWFFATGSQWDVAQTFAWARMFATYAQSMSVLEAAKKTFSGDELCGVCDVVQDARQEGDDEAAGAGTTSSKSFGKLPLAIPAAAVCVTALPPALLRPAATASPPGTPRASPPTPPPRAAA